MNITCDLCGGTLEMKDAKAICTTCGVVYSLESLKRKLNVQNGGNSAVNSVSDTSASSLGKIDNLLNLARLKLRNNPYETRQICDSILEIDCSNSDAWELKILASHDMNGASESFVEYYNSCNSKEKQDRSINFAREYFLKQDYSYQMMQGATLILPICSEISNKLANRYIKEVTQHYNDRCKRLKQQQQWEIDHKPQSKETNQDTKFVFSDICHDIHSQTLDEVLDEIVQYSRLEHSDIYENLFELCKIQISWINIILSFKMWKGEYHHTEYVMSMGVEIYKNHNLMLMFSEGDGVSTRCKYLLKKYKSVRLDCQREIDRKKTIRDQEKRKRINAYLDANPEKKQELICKKTELINEISKLKARKENSIILDRVRELETELDNLRNQLHNLGFFSYKEKKRLNQAILELSISIQKANAEYDSEIKMLDARINDLVRSLEDVDYQLGLRSKP